MFERHLTRLFASAKALDFKNVHSKDEIFRAVFSTLAGNGMRDETHIRLTLSRGEKTTSSMNPAFNVFGCTLVVLAEWKPVESVATYDNCRGVALVTASQRRNPPSCLDSKIHHNNLLNNILPKIQANLAGAADAIMLDIDGYVAETNACNLFAVSGGAVLTPTADHCLPGVTRELVMGLCTELGLRLDERRVSLAEFHAADEVFTTGTMGELTPVVQIDGRSVGAGVPGPVTGRLAAAYKLLVDRPELSTPLPDF
jgi:branched-subunit amino acid aminotransferase/4-amino-4-deoxychorismate lyase